jgi:REP element-mobilizing transposase RayT
MKNIQLSPFPLAYHITIHCYGCWLHGDPAGSVDRNNNKYDTPFNPPNPSLHGFERESLTQPPYSMDKPRRKIVLDTIREVCRYREWTLLAVHVRTNHVHAVVQANAIPEKVMSDFKAYSSRRLNESGFDSKDRKRWARYGSTRYKWKWEEVMEAVDYVLRRQGEPMEVYEKETEYAEG